MMNNPVSPTGFFDKPQRQSPVGILVEAGYMVYRVGRAFWVLLLYFLVKPVDVPAWYLLLGGVVLLVLIGVAGYLAFLNFYFHIDHERGEFVLQQGVLAKKRTAFQLDRIQQVNISQSLLQKITQVYGVEIETAGSSKSEARIRAVSYPVAQALRTRLLAETEETGEPIQAVAPQAENDSPPFVEISLASLFKVGITSRYVESFFILVAFFFGLYDNIRELLQFSAEDGNRLEAYVGSFFVLKAAAAIFGGLILLTVVFNLVRTLVTYFGFVIRKSAKGLSISYGLINSRNILLYPQKVQMLVMVSNYFQRKMGLRWMTIRQASAATQQGVNANVQIPGSSQAASEAIMRFVLGRAPERGVALLPNYRKWLSGALVFIGIPVVAYVGFATVSGFDGATLLGLLAYCALAIVLLGVNYRRARLFVGDDFVIQQYGIWDVRTIIIEPHKIQSVTTKQFFWQRRANVGHLSIQTASGVLVFRFGEFDRIQACVNRWLFQVESSTKPWM